MATGDQIQITMRELKTQVRVRLVVSVQGVPDRGMTYMWRRMTPLHSRRLYDRLAEAIRAELLIDEPELPF